MIKELRNLLYILTIFFFFFYIGKYYFSDNLKKNFNAEDTNLITLKSDTEDIVEHIINTSKKKRKYNFWKLLKNN